MRILTALRWSVALPALLVMLALGGYMVYVTGATVIPYGPTLFDDSMTAAKVVVPLATAMSAFLVAQLQSFIAQRSAVRGKVAAVTATVWPIPVVAWLILVGMFVGQAARSAISLNNESMLMVAAPAAVLTLVLVSHCAVGAVLGRILPISLGAPAVGLASYLWLQWPAAGPPTWLRQLLGLPVGCCWIDQQPSPTALIAGAATAFVWLVGSLMVMSLRARRPGALLGLVVTIGVGVIAGATIARSFSPPGLYILGIPRADSTVCTGERPQTCVWPEFAADAERVQALASASYTAWGKRGLDLPETMTAFRRSTDPSTAYLDHVPYATDVQMRLNIATAVVESAVPHVQMCRTEAGSRASGAATAWLSLVAGLSPDEVESVYPEALSALEQRGVLDQDDTGQTAWFEAELITLRQCETW